MFFKSSLLGLLLFVLLVGAAGADPCGMVPPIQLPDGQKPDISRVGVQQTYVFHKDGLETFVIRPGFEGSVDEFGMLIPFPVPPSLRKVPDAIFEHIEAAIDPPPVVVYAGGMPYESRAGRAAPAPAGLSLQRDEVEVIREEAVGMYSVVVLKAGSAASLKRWMDDHGFRYPKGMDQACDDYVEDGWCFVAVKTRVGSKAGADPTPGMRSVDPSKPGQASFDGHVQGMGFRFESEQLVVPMRLSAFNEGELNNLVYVLSDQPVRVKNLPAEFVVRQLSGEEIYRNVTQPLPVKVIGGTLEDLDKNQLTNLETMRDPVPKNGLARTLFASDLLAVREGKLSHRVEEEEKALLDIGERLGLRGPQVDALNRQVLDESRDLMVEKALHEMKGMTLTVVEGEFPRDVLSKENLWFVPYEIPKEKAARDRAAIAAAPILLLLMLGMARCRAVPLLGLVVLICVGLPVWAAPTDQDLIRALSNPEEAPRAADALVHRRTALPLLLEAAQNANNLIQRGYAITCLAQMGGPQTDGWLREIHENPEEPPLVRTWAAAGRLQQVGSIDELLELASLQDQFPALARPFSKAAVELAERDKLPPGKLILLAVKSPALQPVLAGSILRGGPGPLVEAMTGSGDQQVRRLSAAYLATLASQGDKSVAAAVLEAYRFRPGAKKLPWEGGPLFLPGLQWDGKSSHQLIDGLLRWYVWAELRDPDEAATQPIQNNLRSLQLWSAVGDKSNLWRSAQGVEGWLWAWAGVTGGKHIRALLQEQNAQRDPRFAKLLEKL